MRHGGAGSVVDVAVVQTGSRVILTVTDDGPDILPEERQKIFGHFQRGAAAGADGSGPGLAIIRRFADQLGATIHLQSPEVEKTHFHIAFVVTLGIHGEL